MHLVSITNGLFQKDYNYVSISFKVLTVIPIKSTVQCLWFYTGQDSKGQKKDFFFFLKDFYVRMKSWPAFVWTLWWIQFCWYISIQKLDTDLKERFFPDCKLYTLNLMFWYSYSYVLCILSMFSFFVYIEYVVNWTGCIIISSFDLIFQSVYCNF